MVKDRLKFLRKTGLMGETEIAEANHRAYYWGQEYGCNIACRICNRCVTGSGWGDGYNMVLAADEFPVLEIQQNPTIEQAPEQAAVKAKFVIVKEQIRAADVPTYANALKVQPVPVLEPTLVKGKNKSTKRYSAFKPFFKITTPSDLKTPKKGKNKSGLKSKRFNPIHTHSDAAVPIKINRASGDLTTALHNKFGCLKEEDIGITLKSAVVYMEQHGGAPKRGRRKSIGRPNKRRKKTAKDVNQSPVGMELDDVNEVNEDVHENVESVNVYNDEETDNEEEDNEPMDRKKRYRSSKKGKNAQKKANDKYLLSPKGNATQKKAVRTYESTEQGAAARQKAVRTYESTGQGAAARQKAVKTYQGTEQGAAAMQKAVRTYEETEQGAAARQKAVRTYEETEQGAAARQKAVKTYEGTEGGIEARKKADKRSYVLNKEAKSYTDGQAKARVEISAHVPDNDVLQKWRKTGKRLISYRKKMVKPPFSVSGAAVFKRPQFRKSKQKVTFKSHANDLLCNATSNSLNPEELKLSLSDIFPNEDFKNRSRDWNIRYLSTYLIEKYLELRDSWTQSLYYGTYKLRMDVQEILGKISLAPDSDTYIEKILTGDLNHAKGFEPFFPGVSFKDGVQYKYEDIDRLRKKKTKRVPVDKPRGSSTGQNISLINSSLISPVLKAGLDERLLADSVSIYHGSLLDLDNVDAIVNPANKTLFGHGGLSLAIQNKGGADLEKCLKSMGGCDVGQCKICPGFNLKSPYLLNTVGPVGGQPDADSLLMKSYTSCFEELMNNNLRTIAIPCISTKIFNFPNKRACYLALQATRSFLENNPGKIDKIVFGLYDSIDQSIYRDTISHFFPMFGVDTDVMTQTMPFSSLPSFDIIDQNKDDAGHSGVNEDNINAPLKRKLSLSPHDKIDICFNDISEIEGDAILCPHSDQDKTMKGIDDISRAIHGASPEERNFSSQTSRDGKRIFVTSAVGYRVKTNKVCHTIFPEKHNVEDSFESIFEEFFDVLLKEGISSVIIPPPLTKYDAQSYFDGCFSVTKRYLTAFDDKFTKVTFLLDTPEPIPIFTSTLKVHFPSINIEKCMNKKRHVDDDTYTESVGGGKSETTSKLAKHFQKQIKETNVSGSKRSTEEPGNPYGCNDKCIPVTSDEISRYKLILEKLKDISPKSAREFVENFNGCTKTSRPNVIYKLNVRPRNHPKDCYKDPQTCSSIFTLMNNLSVHCERIRKIYKRLRDIRTAHNYLCDLDAALMLGDVKYLMKLIKVSPSIKSKVLNSRNEEIVYVTEDTMRQKYGNHIQKFYNSSHDLPDKPCVSCNKLTKGSGLKEIRLKWAQKDQYKNLLKYLNCQERRDRGEERVETLIGKHVCNYCYNLMLKNSIPRISLMNGMDTGNAPPVIKDLSPFERIFIKKVCSFQTILKAGTVGGNLPYNERMSKLKGFSISKFLPLQDTLNQLNDEKPSRTIDPRDYLIVHGFPKVTKAVYKHLVDVEKIHAAITWLRDNNPEYKQIIVPQDPDDLLPPDVDDMPSSQNCTMITDDEFVYSSSQSDTSLPAPFSSIDDSDSHHSYQCDEITTTAGLNILMDFLSSDDDNQTQYDTEDEPMDDDTQYYTLDEYEHTDAQLGGCHIESDVLNDMHSDSASVESDEEYDTSYVHIQKMIESAIDELSDSDLSDIEDDIYDNDFEEIMASSFEESVDQSLFIEDSASLGDLSLEKLNNLDDNKDKCKYVIMQNILHVISKKLAAGELCKRSELWFRYLRSLYVSYCKVSGKELLDVKMSFRYYNLRVLMRSYTYLKNFVSCTWCKVTSAFQTTQSSKASSPKFISTWSSSKAKKYESIMQLKESLITKKMNYFCVLDKLAEFDHVCKPCYKALDKKCRLLSTVVKNKHKSYIKLCDLMHEQDLNDEYLSKVTKSAYDDTHSLLKQRQKCCKKCLQNTECMADGFVMNRSYRSTENDDDDEFYDLFTSSNDDLILCAEPMSFKHNSTSCSDTLSSFGTIEYAPTTSFSKESKELHNKNKHTLLLILRALGVVQHNNITCSKCSAMIKKSSNAYKKLMGVPVSDLKLSVHDDSVYKDSLQQIMEIIIISLFNKECFCKSGESMGINCYGDHDPDTYVEQSGGTKKPSAIPKKDIKDISVTSDHRKENLDSTRLSQENPVQQSSAGPAQIQVDNIDDDLSVHRLVDQKTSQQTSVLHGLADPVQNLAEEIEDELDAQKLIEQMTPHDLKNLIDNYTVTGLDNVSGVPNNIENLYQLLKADSDPVPSSYEKLDLLCFPEIFPYGVGGKKDIRSVITQPLQYEKARLWSANGDVRRDIPYMFHLFQENERRKISQGMFASVKNVHGLHANGDVDTKKIKQMMQNDDPNLSRRLTRILSKVPNTEQYWRSHRTKLFAQVEKYGPPTFFVTFSPAEYDWDDLYTHLRKCNSDLPDLNSLTPSELAAKDPVSTSNFIHQRFDALLDFILTADPLGKVISYFVRHEYQGRGTVHFHTFLWIKDAPIINKSSDEDVMNFLRQKLTCRRPDANMEPKLRQLVDKYNTHSCRSYCRRHLKSSNKWRTVCRFGFPRPKTSQFLLHDVLSSIVGRKSKNLKNRLYDLPRSDSERMINDYNPELLLLWGANMDIQFLSENSHSIAHYVTKYITKPDKSNLKDILFEDNDKSVFHKSMKFAYACLRSRELGAHEAIDRVLQNNGELWRSSEKFQFIQTTYPKKRSRTLKSVRDLEKQDEGSRDIYYADLIHDFYPKRPARLDSMSLHSFVETYERAYVQGRSGLNNYIHIKNDAGKVIATMKERKKFPVLYHHQYNIKDEPELFYYSMLSLHKPWRSEQDIRGDSDSYQQEFFKVVDENETLRKFFDQKESLRKARNEMDLKVSEEIDKQRDESSQLPQNENIFSDDNVVRQGLQDFESINNTNESIQSQTDLDNYIASLNTDQLRIFSKITESLDHILDHEENKCIIPDCQGAKPLLMYVSGFGGTGKSYLIKAIVGYMFIQRHVFKRKCDSILTAPTGLAAANITGQTIHSVFNIPVQHGTIPKYQTLSAESLDQTRAVLKNLKCVILDEVSMVSNVLLLYMHLRLKDIFGGDTLFGGKSMILFGDLLQLPPVNALPPFAEIDGNLMQKITSGIKVSMNIWREFEFDQLTINQRQSGDKNALWKEVLKKVRIGELTDKDVKILQSRLIPLIENLDRSRYLDQIVSYYIKLLEKESSAICLLPKRTMVDDFNKAVMTKRHKTVFHIESLDEIDCRISKTKRQAEDALQKMDKMDDPRNTAGLDKILNVARGARIMLRKNMDVGEGLVNGSVGVLQNLIFDKDGKVEKLVVLFDGKEATTEISRDQRKIQIFNNAFLYRKQFPITLAYGLTVHKAQGLSLKCVMADLGMSVFSDGQSYVALSRVTSLEGLHLINFSSAKVTASKEALIEYNRLGGNDGPIPDKKKNVSATDRVWYTTAQKKAIKDAIRGHVNPMHQHILDKPVINIPRTPHILKTIPTRNTGDRSITISTSTACVREIISKVERCDHPVIREIAESMDLDSIYSNIILSNANNTTNRSLCSITKELNPDPFNTMDHTDKWLSSSTLCDYGDYIRQSARSNCGTMVYNMGSYFRRWYMEHTAAEVDIVISESDRNMFRRCGVPLPEKAYLHHAIKQTLLRSDSASTEYEYPDIMKDRLEQTGDPLSQDFIIMFCNDDNAHWYSVVLDNRVGSKGMVYFDSSKDYSSQSRRDRCAGAYAIINDFRDYLRNLLTSRLAIPDKCISGRTHRIRDGNSRCQPNNFDCGPYALINCELFVNKKDPCAIVAESLPLVRAYLLNRLYLFKMNMLTH